MIAHLWGEDPPRSIRRRLTAEIYQLAAEIRQANPREPVSRDSGLRSPR
jgi:hypothetical protein